MSSVILYFFLYCFYNKVLMEEKNMKNRESLCKKVGENLKMARKAKGLTQKEVAKLLNKFQPDYSEYESGKIELDYYKIVFLCELLDITPNDLFGFN